MRDHRRIKRLERRSAVRLETFLSVKVWVLGSPISVLTKDISASGIRIITISSYCFEVGERYQIEISIPREEHSVFLKARVVRISPSRDSADKKEVAFHYTNVSQEDQAKIARFVYRREIERQRLGLQ